MFKHVFQSWLFAQLLFPLLLAVELVLIYGASSIDVFFVIISLLTWILSLPCLLLGWFFLSLIIPAEISAKAKFIWWFVATAIAVEINFIILALTQRDGFFLNNDMLFTIPAIVSIWLVAIMRFRQFKKMDYEVNNYVEPLVLDQQ